MNDQSLPAVTSTTAMPPVPPLRPESDAGALMAIISRAATDPTFDVDKLQKLLEMKERWDASQAKKAYDTAFAAFKSEAVRIIKNKTITDGPLANKRYADLFAVVDSLVPKLSEYGLSHSWSLVKDEKDWMEVACILTHTDGHAETRKMGGPPDAGGAKNAIQARASTLSYLERYSFLAVSGMSTTDQDDDGRGHRREFLETIARAMIEKFDADNEWGAYEEWKTVTDSEEMLKVWSILRPHSKLRAAMKRLDAEAQKAEKK